MICSSQEAGDLYHYPSAMFFPYYSSDAEWLRVKDVVRDICGVPRPVVPYEVRRGRVVSSGAHESDMRNFGKYEEFARQLDEPDTGRVKVVPAPSHIVPSLQIRAELPVPLVSYRDDVTERAIGEWKNTKASPTGVTRYVYARSAEISHSPTYSPRRYDDVTLGAVSESLSGASSAAAVRTSLRLPKPKAPRAIDITSVIREALGPITPTLARKQIKRAFITPDGVSDNVSNVKSNGYTKRDTDKKTLQ